MAAVVQGPVPGRSWAAFLAWLLSYRRVWRGSAVTTVLAAEGYPDDPKKGAAITIPATLPAGVSVFHAGTARGADGILRVNGGRVLNVTAVAPTFREAQRLSRETADRIEYAGKVYRRDIGWREAARS